MIVIYQKYHDLTRFIIIRNETRTNCKLLEIVKQLFKHHIIVFSKLLTYVLFMTDKDNNKQQCLNEQLPPKDLAKEISEHLDKLKLPDEFQNEFDSLLESLEQTIILVLKELDIMMDAENVDCESEVRYKQLVKQLEEEFKLYEALYDIYKVMNK